MNEKDNHAPPDPIETARGEALKDDARDASRLDWLEFNMQSFTTTDDRVEFPVPKWSNLRAAIDAAIDGGRK